MINLSMVIAMNKYLKQQEQPVPSIVTVQHMRSGYRG
jgi:hypothetical protein